jgi:hypothetical protein
MPGWVAGILVGWAVDVLAIQVIREVVLLADRVRVDLYIVVVTTEFFSSSLLPATH